MCFQVLSLLYDNSLIKIPFQRSKNDCMRVLYLYKIAVAFHKWNEVRCNLLYKIYVFCLREK